MRTGTRAARLVLLTCAALGALMPIACAPKATAPTLTPSLRYPDFLVPTVPAGLGSPQSAALLERGWQHLQAGDLKAASQELIQALRLVPDFYPAEAALGYVRLADRAYDAAIAAFDRALARDAGYVPALLGRGDALLGAAREREAIESFKAALARDPSLGEVQRRVEVVSLRLQQEAIATARRAAQAGRYAEAQAAYVRALETSPDSAFLYRDLAEVARLAGEPAVARKYLQRATELDPGDAGGWVQLGELLEAQQDFAGATAAYARAAQIEPGPAARDRLERARRGGAQAGLPPEYGLIPASAAITRGDLAALIGVRLARVLERAPQRDAVVMTDVPAHWAAPWIQAVTRAGVMDAYPNHEFQPGAPVRRADLAMAASRLLEAFGASDPRRLQEWRHGTPTIADIPPENVYYQAAALVVTAGVMALAEGAFLPSRSVTGSEALSALGRLEVLTR